MSVDTPIDAYNEMSKKWLLIDDVYGGTESMRAAGQRRLPKEPAETDAAYEVRLKRSFLSNVLKKSIKRMSSKPFSKGVTMRGSLPDNLEPMWDNVDLTGRGMTQFSREVFTTAAKYGLTHILVDYPAVEIPEGGMTLAEEREMGLRPHFLHVSPKSLIGWKTRFIAGKEVLSQVRFKQTRTVDDGDYGVKDQNIIRVYSENDWEVWEENPKTKKYELVDNGAHTLGRVPLVTFYTEKKSTCVAEPPLEDLAHLNVAHWQSASDQRSILRFARIGILFAKGLSEEEVEGEIAVGPNALIRTNSENADMKYVEHSGNAIGAGRQDLLDLKAEMEVEAMQPLVARSGEPTATAKAIDEGTINSDVQAWVRIEENVLNEAFAMAAEWVKTPLPDDFAVEISNDFGFSYRTTEDIRALIDAKNAGHISSQTFLAEFKRRGVLSEQVDVEEEMERIEEDLTNVAV